MSPSQDARLDGTSETSPLLAQVASEDHVRDQQTPVEAKRTTWFSLPSFKTVHPRYRYLPLIGCLLIFTNEAEFYFKQAASMRAVEAMYCIEYYNIHDPALAARLGKEIPESMCKADIIEKNVANLWANTMLVRMVAAMISTLPLGRFADSSRRWVLVLHKLGFNLSAIWQVLVFVAYPAIPVALFPLGGLFALIGGNFDLGLAVMFAAYADVIPNPAERTALFLLTTSMQYVAQLMCPAIGGILMNLDGQGGTVLVAMGAGVAMGISCLCITFFLWPETIQESKDPAIQQRQSSTSGETDVAAQVSKDEWTSRRRRAWKLVSMKTLAWKADLHAMLLGLGIANTLVLALTMLCVATGVKAIDWYGLLQYPVVRLGWSYSSTAMVPSLQAVIQVALFLVVLPYLARLTTPLPIMLASLFFLVLGSLFMGFATTAPIFLGSMVLYTLGAGFAVTAQGFIANRIAKRNLAKVLSLLSLASMGGKVGASILWPRILAVGLDGAERGREWMKGLPMFVAASVFALASIGLAFVSLQTRRTNQEDTVGNHDEEQST